MCLFKAVVFQESVLQAGYYFEYGIFPVGYFLWDNIRKAFLSLSSHEEFRYSEVFSFFAYS